MMYKCNDCGHVFLGSDFTTTCPECGSSNIEVQKSNNEVIVKIKDWIRNNKLLAIIISVIFLLIIIPKGDEKLEIGNNINSNSDNVDFTYKLKFQPKGDHFSVFMINEKGGVSKNFSIWFLIKLSAYLGFYPNSENYERKYFNLETGEFSNHLSYYCLSEENKKYFALLLNNIEIDIPYKNRKELLKSLQKYYSLHHYNIDNLKSYDVIESLRI